ncbi:GNAT family N-acetyltransferase [Arenibacter sp. ARW7G5Y1]|uniref:GNAT family N-acetyltransferase n=1 Tax=Arenibacter sp. ARW7G5Y1 TaxID=2135619 RepID=UPI000D760CAD|nr:GNAT family N-acetyltransferase [Arenibacter sp. ARW7G5Y1]PXX30717.1 phosphinothricin acetyltransferase [Arenibacter sp. ARW7G5Y1]
MEIRKMKNSDWPSVAEIYRQGMDTGFATFEKVVPSFEVWDAAHLEAGRLVAAKGETILGWAALSPVSSRCVYGGVAEVSVYIGQGSRGQGVGKLLIQQLIVESEKAGLWTLQSGIFPENKGSVELHRKMGFRFIGKRERVGKRDNVWKDNLLFERRSTIIGVD